MTQTMKESIADGLAMYPELEHEIFSPPDKEANFYEHIHQFTKAFGIKLNLWSAGFVNSPSGVSNAYKNNVFKIYRYFWIHADVAVVVTH